MASRRPPSDDSDRNNKRLRLDCLQPSASQSRSTSTRRSEGPLSSDIDNSPGGMVHPPSSPNEPPHVSDSVEHVAQAPSNNTAAAASQSAVINNNATDSAAIEVAPAMLVAAAANAPVEHQENNANSDGATSSSRFDIRTSVAGGVSPTQGTGPNSGEGASDADVKPESEELVQHENATRAPQAARDQLPQVDGAAPNVSFVAQGHPALEGEEAQPVEETSQDGHNDEDTDTEPNVDDSQSDTESSDGGAQAPMGNGLGPHELEDFGAPDDGNQPPLANGVGPHTPEGFGIPLVQPNTPVNPVMDDPDPPSPFDLPPAHGP